MPTIQRIGNVFYRVPVGQMDRAVDFYGRVLGLPLKFRDGDAWVAFDVAGVTLALEGTTSGAGGSGGATVSFRVDDLDGMLALLRERGLPAGEITVGGHERRLELVDPAGNGIVLYEPLARAAAPKGG